MPDIIYTYGIIRRTLRNISVRCRIWNDCRKTRNIFRKKGLSAFLNREIIEPVSGEFGMLRSYLLAKLLWDPYTDIERHKQEFLTAYYGGGGSAVGKYLDLIHKIVLENNRDFNLVSSAVDIFKDLITEETLEEMDALWECAVSAAAGDEVSLLHVQRSELQYQYYKMLSKRREFSDESEYETLTAEFNNHCGQLGVSYFSEGNPIPWNN